MAKFKSRIKGNSKGKRWPKGQSSNSNPNTKKFREMAKSRFFQENLSNSGLTQDAVKKHDNLMTYGHSSVKEKFKAEEVMSSAETFDALTEGNDNSDIECESQRSGSYRSFRTFASNYTQCSNASFNKLLTRFDSNNTLHHSMLAILAAITEIIKAKGGKESSTEYYITLMESLKSSDDEQRTVATLSLLAMGMKSVPQPVLRKQFSKSAAQLTEILDNNADTENTTLLQNVIRCLAVLLRAQERVMWDNSSTKRVFENVFAFTSHLKPKVRKAAQHAVSSILRGSCFMVLSEDKKVKNLKVHPASDSVAEHCLSQLSAESIQAGHRPALHTLTLLRHILCVFKKEDMKAVCESILSLMTHNNIYIKKCCLHTLHDLFMVPLEYNNIWLTLAGQLTRALMSARPPSNDTAMVLAWTSVMEAAYGCIARLDINFCLPQLDDFVNICVSELWQSDVPEVNTAATNALKAILNDCVKPGLETDMKHRANIENVFRSIGSGLEDPFNQAMQHVILTIAVCFEVGNEKVEIVLEQLLKKMNDRRENYDFRHTKEADHAAACALKSLGPEFVLGAIPLKEENDVNMNRTWLLPILKEKLTNCTLKFFSTYILELATISQKKYRELLEVNIREAYKYELLSHQFWSLLPTICSHPTDIKNNFKTIAKVLGNVLKDNPEFRLPVLQSLRKLIACSEDNPADRQEISRFAKNYMPILMNIYVTPVKGSTAEGQRLATLETIQVYLTICDQVLREELFDNAMVQLNLAKDDHFIKGSMLDILRLLVLYQTVKNIQSLFDIFVYPLLETALSGPKKCKEDNEEKIWKVDDEEENCKEDDEEGNTKQMKYKDQEKLQEMEHKKAFRILEEVFKSDNGPCKEFLNNNYKKLQKLLMNSLNKVASSSKGARLRCIAYLISIMPQLTSESKVVKSALAEAIVCTKDINAKCRKCAFALITSIGNVLKTQKNGMASFIELLLAGLSSLQLKTPTIHAVSAALFTFHQDMDLPTIQGLLETICKEMMNSNRQIVAAAMNFIKVYTKVLPNDVLSGSVPVIFKTLATMCKDYRRFSRTEIGHFLTRMIRKFGADFVEKLLPEEDEMMKMVRNLRKIENRKKRHEETQRNGERLPVQPVRKGPSMTMEEILKDSDSDSESLDEDDHPKKKLMAKRKVRNQAWIEEDAENIVDLADVSSSRKITATDPKKKQNAIEIKKKKKDGGFKTAPDGRLIISENMADDDDDEDDKRPSGDVGSDTDDTDDESKATNLRKPGVKRRYDDISVKSGRSLRSHASTARASYVAGGKGIHRALSPGTSASKAGTEYRSKKAKGDIKKKGKPDPYAYIPLSRKDLNKKKKKLTSKQFKGVVKSKAKGKAKKTK